MIDTVSLIDFMSHARTKAAFRGASTIAVVGENGSGKSALLESIPYALYGAGRDSSSRLSRINGGGSHKVVFSTNGYRVERGRTTSGKGVVKVYRGEDLIAQGKDAARVIEEEVVGMNLETFMLTAFFGLSDNRNADTLIRVYPSTRLETLQKIAEVAIYKKFHERASYLYKQTQAERDAAVEVIKHLDPMLKSTSELRKRKEKADKTAKALSEKVRKAKTERQRLTAEEDRFRALLRASDSAKIKTKALKGDLEEQEKIVRESEKTIDDITSTYNESLARKDEVAGEAAELLEDDAAGRLKGLSSESTKKDTIMSLKVRAVKMEGSLKLCPLCGHDLPSDIVKRWSEDIEKLQGELDAIADESQSCTEIVAKVEELQSELKELDFDCRTMLDKASTTKETMEKSKRTVSRLKVDLSKQSKVEEKLDEEMSNKYKGIDEKITKLTELIETTQEQIGTAKQESKDLKEEITENLANKKTIEEKNKQARDLFLSLEALDMLMTAWNRYGIPLTLVKNLYRAIEDKATRVYQEFDNGAIWVREVEDRGKPGVEFVLWDRKGERTFAQLSAGEKLMFFISVRVAIAQIVSSARDVKAGFLILDEAMGNLSPNRRDDLVRLVNKILRRMFPQVVMVSHTEMRDIFDRTIKVEAANDVSEISVVA